MSITKIEFPNPVPVDDTDWPKMILQQQYIALGINNPLNYEFSGDFIKEGAMFISGASVYLADSNTAIAGTPSDYVKLVPAGSPVGNRLDPEYVSDLTGVTWNSAFNHYGDVSDNCYAFDEGKAVAVGTITDPKTIIGHLSANPFLKGLRATDDIQARTGLVYFDTKNVSDVDAIRFDGTDYHLLGGASAPGTDGLVGGAPLRLQELLVGLDGVTSLGHIEIANNKDLILKGLSNDGDLTVQSADVMILTSAGNDIVIRNNAAADIMRLFEDLSLTHYGDVLMTNNKKFIFDSVGANDGELFVQSADVMVLKTAGNDLLIRNGAEASQLRLFEDLSSRFYGDLEIDGSIKPGSGVEATIVVAASGETSVTATGILTFQSLTPPAGTSLTIQKYNSLIPGNWSVIGADRYDIGAGQVNRIAGCEVLSDGTNVKIVNTHTSTFNLNYRVQ